MLREGDLLVGLLHRRVVLALALGDELGALALRLLELRAETAEERVREELGGGDLVGALGGDLRELAVARRELLTAHARPREGSVVVLHLEADHLREILERARGQVVLLLELVERVLRLLELLLEVIELAGEPHDGVARRVDHLVEVLLDVRARDGVGEAAGLLGTRVLDLHEDEAAALDRLDDEPTAQRGDGGVERRGRLRRVAEEVRRRSGARDRARPPTERGRSA